MPKVSFNVNGKIRELELDTRTTLLDALREHLHLTGKEPRRSTDSTKATSKETKQCKSANLGKLAWKSLPLGSAAWA
jgi:aerobic-type carbon monoxide dehydrogenase small subunit (CoxS/CutS family)